MASFAIIYPKQLIYSPGRLKPITKAPNKIQNPRAQSTLLIFHQSKKKTLLVIPGGNMEGGDDGVDRLEDSKDMQQQSKAFDKLTDRVEDRQLDSTRVQEAMASISASKEADIQAARLREKELAAVKINAADIDIIANELELDKKVAERTLREHKGDAVAAIRSLLY